MRRAMGGAGRWLSFGAGLLGALAGCAPVRTVPANDRINGLVYHGQVSPQHSTPGGTDQTGYLSVWRYETGDDFPAVWDFYAQKLGFRMSFAEFAESDSISGGPPRDHPFYAANTSDEDMESGVLSQSTPEDMVVVNIVRLKTSPVTKIFVAVGRR